MEILYVLLVLLLATQILGEIAVRIGQPALGEDRKFKLRNSQVR